DARRAASGCPSSSSTPDVYFGQATNLPLASRQCCGAAVFAQAMNWPFASRHRTDAAVFAAGAAALAVGTALVGAAALAAGVAAMTFRLANASKAAAGIRKRRIGGPSSGGASRLGAPDFRDDYMKIKSVSSMHRLRLVRLHAMRAQFGTGRPSIAGEPTTQGAVVR